jgi:PAS domain S-box-containing protein
MGRTNVKAVQGRGRREAEKQVPAIPRNVMKGIHSLSSGRRANNNGSDSESRGVSVRNLEPTGREVSFGTDEIIVSKTDTNGRITYANRVFLEVSGFVEAEVIGQPHSFIRHPDMPRCVFKMLWDSIQSGKEIFAYVVNMTKSGDHYWVLAHVTPTYDERGMVSGYHSMRRCPERSQTERVKSLYARLCAEERMHARKTDAVAASSELLKRIVAEHHATYEEFVFSI